MVPPPTCLDLHLKHKVVNGWVECGGYIEDASLLLGESRAGFLPSCLPILLLPRCLPNPPSPDQFDF
ncbi:hypothetical protein INR49_029082 [Caranx melampygus]|nr:hypothetical protein INR49_029082 [Caranx melampygus]